VLDPLERMIEKVKLIAKNPLAAATDEIDQAGLMSFMNKEEKTLDKKELKIVSEYETLVLEKAIVRRSWSWNHRSEYDKWWRAKPNDARTKDLLHFRILYSQ
jgi:hypothetical protein